MSPPSAEVLRASPRADHPQHWFVLPWLAAVDLRTISAVQAEHGQLVLQLHGGNYLRSPRHPDAEKAGQQIIDLLTKMPDVHVTVCQL